MALNQLTLTDQIRYIVPIKAVHRLEVTPFGWMFLTGYAGVPYSHGFCTFCGKFLKLESFTFPYSRTSQEHYACSSCLESKDLTINDEDNMPLYCEICGTWIAMNLELPPQPQLPSEWNPIAKAEPLEVRYRFRAIIPDLMYLDTICGVPGTYCTDCGNKLCGGCKRPLCTCTA